MSLFYRCDRCKAEKAPPIMNQPTKPTDWETVCGAHLCSDCARQLHRFLSGMDPAKIHLNERVWVKREGKAHPYQLWELMQEYGPKLSLAGPPPFEENTIYFRDPSEVQS